MASRLRSLVLILALLPLGAAALENRLRDHPSPYLALHGEDPVPWQDWSEEVRRLAQAEDRILFISSGYFSCHWCHVMQRESYADPAVAKLLADHFVPVKVDRELEPALDQHLIDFTERTQGRAGWPLNVFLTPRGYPLVGMTYLPKDQFARVLERLVKLWSTEREEIRSRARQMLLDASVPAEPSAETAPVAAAQIRRLLVRDALAFGDDMSGGFGRQSKFPMAPQLLALLQIQAAHPDPELAALLRLTLDQMAANGLRDHIAGGFFRYTVDPGWQVPHYEKMLYTQALLALVYLRAAPILEVPEYRDVARDTLDFVLAEMTAEGGAYVASLSAVDAQGEEGGGYLWPEDRLRDLFAGQDLELVRRHWGMQGVPAADGGHLPIRGESVVDLARALEQPRDVLQAQLDTLRGRLLEARRRHAMPRDGKVLAAWNGLLLAALADAQARLPEARFRRAGADLARYLRTQLVRDDGATLLRALAAGAGVGKAGLEDHAFVAWGLTAWGEATGDQHAYTAGLRLLLAAWERFYDGAGWRSTDSPSLPGMAPVVAQTGGPLPAPSATVMRLALESGHPGLVRQVRDAVERARAATQEQPFWHAELAVLLQR